MAEKEGGDPMEDHQIVALYWQRDESAIGETQRKYGRYLKQIAYQILADTEDSLEVVNDTYMSAWNSMPVQRPDVLSSYLGKITRQISIDRYRKRNSQKRKGSQYALSLEELAECVAGGTTPEEAADAEHLAASISAYLWSLPEEMRYVFLWRYFFLDSIPEIARRQGASVSKIKSMLHRVRQGLKSYLEKEGYVL